MPVSCVQGIVGSKEEMKAGFKKLDELNRLMRSVGGAIRGGGGGAVDTSALTAKWEELEVKTITNY